MITKKIALYDFLNDFEKSDTYKDKFTRPALIALYDYLDDLSDDNNPIELDIVAIACDFTEYETAWEAMEQYQPDDMPTLDASDTDQNYDLSEIQERLETKALEWLQDRTTVITFDGGIIIQNF